METKVQNFTMFATANGYPSDYDTLFEAQYIGSLGLVGHVSKRARKARQQRQSDRTRNNLIAHDEFNKAIIDGKVVDPSGDVTKEKLLTYKQERADAVIKSKRDGLYRQIEIIEGLGRMSHLSNGKLKISYQRVVDFCNQELITLS